MLSKSNEGDYLVVRDGSRSWQIGCTFSGPEKIPVLAPATANAPAALIPFHHTKSGTASSNGFVHFFVQDHHVERIWRNPARYVSRLGRYSGILTPDFSLYRSMAPHQRVSNVCASRAVGVFYQERGIQVIPTVRWAVPSDFLFCFAGLPKESVVAISTHGCIRSQEDRHYFKGGLSRMLEVLAPLLVLVHGAMPPDVFSPWRNRVNFRHYPSAITQVHAGEV